METFTKKKLSKGKSHPLGATCDSKGVNFAVYSKHAEGMYLLLFNRPDNTPSDVIPMEKYTDDVWCVHVDGLKKGQLYGYKAAGQFDPYRGYWFNENKLLLDPYSKSISHKPKNLDGLLFSYAPHRAGDGFIKDDRDNSRIMAKSVVIDDDFSWTGDKKPDVPIDKLIIYESHLKGFTAHNSSGVINPGTYLGFAEKIPYLKSLGINAVEFLPLHEFYVRDFLAQNGLNEYWGYNSICFFSPESGYTTNEYHGCAVYEFKTMVKALHKAGIEVILDVVYNHTGENDELCPTMSFRGLDNPTYYYLKNGWDHAAKSLYVNDTGCGNTVNSENPVVRKMIMDSLRYWVKEMRVDCFRFDLATIITRKDGKFSKDSTFFEDLKKDPILSKIKIIAEPWDMTTYQVGNFPAGWLEWNGRYRDVIRRYVKGESALIKDAAIGMTGSADIYKDDSSLPHGSVNYVACHDGFTLNDIFSYNTKHNEANLEGNRDGMWENFSWNCGVEGDTMDPGVLALRKRLIKNSLCCLFFSLGVPMLLSGDEMQRTQGGNNNAYCQDNGTSWLDWSCSEKNADIVAFVKKAIAFRKNEPIFMTLKADIDSGLVKAFNDKLYRPDWNDSQKNVLCLAYDERIFLILNFSAEKKNILIPAPSRGKWHRVVDTSLPDGEDFLTPGNELELKDKSIYGAEPRSFILLRSI